MRAEDRKLVMELPDDSARPHHGSTAVVVASCSRFSQVWMPFFTLFRRFWPDCPYPVYLLTDIERARPLHSEPWFGDPLPADADGVRLLSSGNDLGWCRNMSLLLDRVFEKRIILFQEDFLLTGPVDTPVIRRLVRYSLDHEAGCLRLMPCPGPDAEWRHPFLGLVSRGAPYEVSLQLAIWKSSTLTMLVRQNDSPWEMERHGRRNASDGSSFLSVHRESNSKPGGPAPYFITAVTRGRWEKGALNLLRREDVPMDGITERIP